jgi:hypothetical protein
MVWGTMRKPDQWWAGAARARRRQALLQRLDALEQGIAVGERARLLGGMGADLADPGAGGEIGVGLAVVDHLDRAAHADLAAQRLPVHEQRGARIGEQLAALSLSKLVKKQKPRWSRALSSTMRTSGMPAESTVASAMACGSLGSASWASANHSSNSENGSMGAVSESSNRRSVSWSLCCIALSLAEAGCGRTGANPSLGPGNLDKLRGVAI